MENKIAPDRASFSSETFRGSRGEPAIINFTSDPWTISGEIAAYYHCGMLFYDLEKVTFINNTGIAKILEALKSHLKENIEVRFINVNNRIRQRIQTLALDHILICV
jgi:hypothetical protein